MLDVAVSARSACVALGSRELPGRGLRRARRSLRASSAERAACGVRWLEGGVYVGSSWVDAAAAAAAAEAASSSATRASAAAWRDSR